uniref:Uncharacterized protein n=1 Tax=Panagrellus redivivus TaxID=6233 RepID=A0A7E4VZR7_PANRE
MDSFCDAVFDGYLKTASWRRIRDRQRRVQLRLHPNCPHRRNVYAFFVHHWPSPYCPNCRQSYLASFIGYLWQSEVRRSYYCALLIILWVYAVKYPQKEASLRFREVTIASVNEDLDDTENQCFTKFTSLELSDEIISIDFGYLFDEKRTFFTVFAIVDDSDVHCGGIALFSDAFM